MTTSLSERADGPGILDGLRVVELADETAAHTGLLLAGLGADVIKVEPPQGSSTRAIGPFVGAPSPETSLFFWQHNRGKRSLVVDPASPADVETLVKLIGTADVLLLAGADAAWTVGHDQLAESVLRAQFPRLVVARLTPFGDDGPWAGHQGSDLVHLALGGPVMNCGYDPLPDGTYDLPPIAPAAWNAYVIAGEQMMIGIMAAVVHQARTGAGQSVSCAVHEAVAKSTELDLMNWVFRRAPLNRQTCRHAAEKVSTVPTIASTKDGRWIITMPMGAKNEAQIVEFLTAQGMSVDLEDAAGAEGGRNIPGSSAVSSRSARLIDQVARFVHKHTYDSFPWLAAQDAGVVCAPLRKPDENVEDPHWMARGTFASVEHPELGRSFTYAVSKWISTEPHWTVGRRAPLLGEDTATILEELAKESAPTGSAPTGSAPTGSVRTTGRYSDPFFGRNEVGGAEVGRAEVGRAEVGRAEVGRAEVGRAEVGRAGVGRAEVGRAEVGRAGVGRAEVGRADGAGGLSPHGKPFPLAGVRIFDFSWFLASAGGTRFLTALGAECIKVEWKANPDTRIAAMAPLGGRAARDVATGPLPGVTDPDMGGQFNNKNPGKRGLSLNVRHPEGLAIARKLIAISDIVAEGFSPGVLDRWGLGYAALCEIKPDIIYAQQSGMGTAGSYGRLRAVGPIAAALSGVSEMSGLPEPAMPAGWGYSYLDWIGAYSFATAMLAALHYRDRTGRGQWIDASQTESGIFLTGGAVLEASATGRSWTRTGNRSVTGDAAPHGIYRCAGDDRWIAIACLTDANWRALATLVDESWARADRFATLAGRLTHQDELDALVGAWTRGREDYALMDLLQGNGIPAGVCQTAGDRCDRDPQLAHLNWLTEVTGTKIGRWPLAEFPVRLEATPAHIGGPIDRAAPCYGEDNEWVLGELLGMSSGEISRLAEDGVI